MSRVRGPSSALTEFLRSRGIRVNNTSTASNRRRSANQEEQAVTSTDGDTAEQEASSPAAASGELDGDAEAAAQLNEELESSTRKRKRPSTAASIAAKKKAAAKKAKKGDDSDSDYHDSDDVDDDDSRPGSSGNSRYSFSHKNRVAPGQIDFCAQCNKRFTVTVYNKPSSDGQGMLCSVCGSASPDGDSRARPPPTLTRQKSSARKKRNKATIDGEISLIPSLQDCAIRKIAEHIDDVEALGDIGVVNMDKICQIISRNRRLNDDTLLLFLESSLQKLAIYDGAKITGKNYLRIAQECPNLVELDLRFCGQLTDDALDFYAQHLSMLRSVSFCGAFLPTINGWIRFFESDLGQRLEKFVLTDSARFDVASSAALAFNCPSLRHLTLSKMAYLDDGCITQFGTLTQLESLDISWAAGIVTDACIIDLLSKIGHSLQTLNLSGLRDLTDAVLLQAVLPYCPNLQTLKLDEVDLLTDAGVADYFTALVDQHAPGLTELSVERCSGLGDAAVRAILRHSGSTVRSLNLNSLDELTHPCLMDLLDGILSPPIPTSDHEPFVVVTDAIKSDLRSRGKVLPASLDDERAKAERRAGRIAEVLPQCECIDLSFIRAVNDAVLATLVGHAAPKLSKVIVWGDNRVTEAELPRPGVLIVGRE